MAHYVLGLGSNLGSRGAHLDAALALLPSAADCELLRVSPRYESDPLSPPQPRYLNAAAAVQCALPASELLARLHTIEHGLGRDRSREARWGSRTLDLDILWSSEASSGAAEVPHPRLRERWFALRPMLAVAPDLEPDYAAALLALPTEALRVCAPARSELVQTDDRIHISATASDLPDALAASLAALGRHLGAGPSPAACEVATRVGPCARGHELESCWTAALDVLASGRLASVASIAVLEAGRFELRLLPGLPHARNLARLALLRAEPSAAGDRCTLRTDLRAPAFRAS